MEVLAVGTDWAAASLTWNNRPTPEPVAVASFTIGSTDAEWYPIDVTSRVASERAAGRSSVAFVVAQTERNGRLAYLYSPSSNDAPYLEITLADGPPATTTTTSTTTTSTTTTSTTTTSTTTTTTTVPPQQSVTLPLPAGSHVRGGTAAATNFSGSYLHEVCNNGSQQYTRETYLGIPVDAFRGLGEPVAATLQVWARMSSGDASPMTVALATADWDPSTITWSTRPGSATSPTAEFTIASTADTAYDIDVTALVLAGVAQGASTLTFVVRQAERNGRLGYIHTAARSTRYPRLTITPA